MSETPKFPNFQNFCKFFSNIPIDLYGRDAPPGKLGVPPLDPRQTLGPPAQSRHAADGAVLIAHMTDAYIRAMPHGVPGRAACITAQVGRIGFEGADLLSLKAQHLR